MHPADITASLRKAGSSQAQIARKLGCTRSNVTHCVSGRSRSPRVRSAISRAIGLPVKAIWPPKE
jgi:lambda repressor-like predicted transcriptional regulator